MKAYPCSRQVFLGFHLVARTWVRTSEAILAKPGEFDLVVMTGHALWGCVPQVPALDVYEICREDGTPAAGMDGHVPDELVRERLAECADVQDPITEASRDALVGAHVDVLVDGTDDDTGDPIGSTHREAPEIDGVVRIGGAFARPGARVPARVTSALGPDLIAEPV